MKNKEIVGIDVSKKVLDIYILSEKHHFKISNDPRGFADLIELCAGKLGDRFENVFFCFEETGRYSKLLSVFLQESQFQFTALNALDIKRSMGLTRGKTDKKDARMIALYAALYLYTLINNKYEHTMCMLLIFFSFWFFFFSLSTVINLLII